MTDRVVKVPDIGEGIAEVELVEWHVAVGDTIVADQVLADLMTDKATVEVPAPVAGVVTARNGNPGDKLAVGSELVRIAGEGAAAAVASTASGADADAATVRAPAKAAPPAPAGAAAPPAPAPVESAAAPVAPATGKPLASPSVRRQARELAVDLARVPATGPGGRVLHEDVVRFAAGALVSPAPASRYAPRTGETEVPVIGLRRQIAQRMAETLRIPHFTYVEEVDVTELEALRARLNAERARSRGRLTLLPFLMRAIVLAAPSFPQINARYDDAAGVVTRFAAVHIGIATQSGSGLMVPVVRHAEARDLWGSAAEVARLAEAARGGRATREDLSGSTITITSLGPRGGIVTTPIINAPEVAIVGVNRIVERPAIRGGMVVPRLSMNLSSSFDHRVVDGHDAAEFVQALRGYLECPALLFVD
ncbi:MAG: 2-oxo acid dehydrogenase subunit E2 [Betaproteobacteria bacterium]|nr:2-oxo acid dehydrogenase subunit E2 [Betaproteobacteria bacterium]